MMTAGQLAEKAGAASFEKWDRGRPGLPSPAYESLLRRLFDLVSPDKTRGAHWKDRIEAVIPVTFGETVTAKYVSGGVEYTYCPSTVDLMEAVSFFTATEAVVTRLGRDGLTNMLLVEADGYRAGPAGDH